MVTKSPDRLPVERVAKLLMIHRRFGRLTWRRRMPSFYEGGAHPAKSAAQFNARFAGKEALTATKSNGHRFGIIDGVPVQAARVVWALSFGAWPLLDVGFHNGNVADLRPSNLFLKKRGRGRRAVRSDSASGVSGVRLVGRRFEARLTVQGRLKTLGRFDTLEEATVAVERAKAASGRSGLSGRDHGSPMAVEKRRPVAVTQRAIQPLKVGRGPRKAGAGPLKGGL